MKKNLLFSVMALVAIAMGCSKSDGGDSYSSQDLVGNWTIEYDVPGDCTDKVTFYTAGRMHYKSYRDDSGVCTYDESRSFEGTYSVNGSKLVLERPVANGGRVLEFTIEELSSTKIITKNIDGDKTVFYKEK